MLLLAIIRDGATLRNLRSALNSLQAVRVNALPLTAYRHHRDALHATMDALYNLAEIYNMSGAEARA